MSSTKASDGIFKRFQAIVTKADTRLRLVHYKSRNTLYSKFLRVLFRAFSSAILATIATYIILQKPLMEGIQADQANLFLATMAQVLGGLIAIIFTVSALAVSIISDRYTSQLTSRFINDPITWTTFVALL